MFILLTVFLYCRWYNPKSGNLWDQMSVTLLKADYHGALLKVASSLCTSMIGLEGIVVIDTKFTFKVVGKDDVCRSECRIYLHIFNMENILYF